MQNLSLIPQIESCEIVAVTRAIFVENKALTQNSVKIRLAHPIGPDLKDIQDRN